MEKQDYNGPILEIDQLSISFFTRLNEIPAVMDFQLHNRAR
jgi:peptide/nickel transport system ATP-binding protein